MNADIFLDVKVCEDMAEVESSEWLLELLREVQLEQFFVQLRDDLQVTR